MASAGIALAWCVLRSRLPPPPARRSRRPLPERYLRALAKAGICLPSAEVLRQLIEHGARLRQLQGQPDLAADALRMLWCPALLAGAGVVFLAQALLLAGAGLRRRRSTRFTAFTGRLPGRAEPACPTLALGSSLRGVLTAPGRRRRRSGRW